MDSLKCLRTNKYTLHYFETATGLKFVLTSDNDTPSLKEELKNIYSDVYVNLIVKNPLINPKEVITCENFKTRMLEILNEL